MKVMQEAKAIESFLIEALEEYADNNEIEMDVNSFEEAQVLTKNKGVVIRMGPNEFLISILGS